MKEPLNTSLRKKAIEEGLISPDSGDSNKEKKLPELTNQGLLDLIGQEGPTEPLLAELIRRFNMLMTMATYPQDYYKQEVEKALE